MAMNSAAGRKSVQDEHIYGVLLMLHGGVILFEILCKEVQADER